MDTDSDTFLTAVYTEIDTLLQTDLALPPCSGPTPKMSDSEVLTLAIIGHWRGSSERALLRWAQASLADAFPVLLSQSAFNRRVRRLGPVLTQLVLRLAEVLGAAVAPYEVVDAILVPVARCCRGARHRLFADEAGFGVGGSDHRLQYGCALLLVVAPDGPITGFVVGSGQTQERWLLDAVLTWRVDPGGVPWTVDDLAARTRRGQGWSGPSGPIWWPDSVGTRQASVYVTDQGFHGQVWHAHWVDETAAEVVAGGGPDPHLATAHHQRRQIVETINSLLTDVLHLAYPRAKTMWGVVCRLAAKCAAVNFGIWGNRLLGRPDLAHATLFNA